MATFKETKHGSTAKAEMTPPARSLSRKRAYESEATDEKPLPVPAAKKKRSTTKQRSATDPYDPANLLVDSIRPGLTLVIVGLNPGLMTAATGHAYSHPSNLFWKLLSQSGITDKRHEPRETHDLMDLYSIGNTNICARPTRSGDGLTKKELLEGAAILSTKIAVNKPEAVCIVGKGVWETVYRQKIGRKLQKPEFSYGWQDEKLWLGRTVSEDGTVEYPGVKTFVATSTSGLAAGMTPAEKLAVWKPLGEWMRAQRGLSAVQTEDPIKSEEME